MDDIHYYSMDTIHLMKLILQYSALIRVVKIGESDNRTSEYDK